jgi:tRNA(Ile)-lysidine synthase
MVRPLLELGREDIRDYASKHKLKFRQDRSNFSPAFLRNRIRHSLVPVLERDFQASLATTISRSMELLQTENNFVDQQAQEWLERKQPAFSRLHPALRRRCVLLQLRKLLIEPDFELIERLLERPGQWVSCGRHAQVRLTKPGTVERRDNTATQFRTETLHLSLTGETGSAVFGGIRFSWRITAIRGHGIQPSRGGREYFDVGAVGNSVLLRHWKPGDRFQPIGMKHAVKVQDLFMNQKVPAERRRTLVVAEASDGGIFWIEGLRIGERYKLSGSSACRLSWSYKTA